MSKANAVRERARKAIEAVDDWEDVQVREGIAQDEDAPELGPEFFERAKRRRGLQEHRTNV